MQNYFEKPDSPFVRPDVREIYCDGNSGSNRTGFSDGIPAAWVDWGEKKRGKKGKKRKKERRAKPAPAAGEGVRLDKQGEVKEGLV